MRIKSAVLIERERCEREVGFERQYRCKNKKVRIILYVTKMADELLIKRIYLANVDGCREWGRPEQTFAESEPVSKNLLVSIKRVKNVRK